jgi:hypothetical protein
MGYLESMLGRSVVEIIEHLADWDSASARASTHEQAQEIADEIIGEHWNGFVTFDWSFGCGFTCTKPCKPGDSIRT